MATMNPASVLALFVFTGVAIAQVLPLQTTREAPLTIELPAQANAARPTPENSTASPNVSYVDGQLTIDAHNATLAEVLTQVTALTGVRIDILTGAHSERMTVIKY